MGMLSDFEVMRIRHAARYWPMYRVARLAHVSPATVQRIVRGEIHREPRNCEQLLKDLGVTHEVVED